MSYYYPGYAEAMEKVRQMDRDQLLRQIDSLYGRDNLKFGDGIDEIREEALRQTREEFTDKHSDEYERTQHYVKFAHVMNRW